MALTACQDPKVPTTLEQFQGSEAQTAAVNTAVANAPAVRVLDQNGDALGGVSVTFSVTQGGGSVASPTTTSNSQGVASVGRWTLGTAAGSNALSATVEGLTPVTFQATGTPGTAAALAFQNGEGQQARVGEPVTTRPSVRVTDSFDNPTPDVGVTFEVAAGGGQVGGAEQTTNESGIATVGGWTMGEMVGENTLRATIAGGASATVNAQATPGDPAALSKQAGDGQTAQVDTDVEVPPSVEIEDQFGNPVPNVSVDFSTSSEALPAGLSAPAAVEGTVEPASVTTDAQGVATVTRWHLGTQAGQHVLTAQVGLRSVRFTATATAGPPASMTLVAGDDQTALAGTAVPVAPSVQVMDEFDNAVEGATVTFVVLTGDGSVQGATQQTDASGIAAVDSWTLGPTPGANTMEARLEGLAPVAFSATGTASLGPPASITILQGNNQSAPVGTAVAVAPAVVVRDASSNVLQGITVTWVILGGGGSVTGANSTTNSVGVATVGGWTLGASPGTNTLEARVTGVTSASFVATGTGGGGGGAFNIEVRFVGGLTASQEAIFTQAEQRWESVITGDVPDILIVESNPCGDATLPNINETIDDLVIFAKGEPIDGSGKVLGQAGPCSVRSGGGGDGLPIYGQMMFDEADLADLEASGRLLDVITHEMGHVLGYGTLWNFGPFSLLFGEGGPDPYFIGSGAVAQFDAVGGAAYSGHKVPVENQGGTGTRDAHWRESIFDNELMTGYLDSGSNPLSVVTVGSLADMGYTVDLDQADAYTLPPIVGAPGREEGEKLQLRELPMPPPELVGPDGEVVRGPGNR